jgi:hypothetical protein
VQKAAKSSACPGTFAEIPNQASVKDFTCTCAADATGSGAVWGTSPYTTDSSICAAARHAGATTSKGGEVTLKKSAGCPSYAGSTANGVTTTSWGSFDTSFYFPGNGDSKCAAAAAPSTSVSAGPSASASGSADGAAPEPPPMTAEGIPNAPITTAIIRGATVQGYVVAWYYKSNDQLELTFVEGTAPTTKCPSALAPDGKRSAKLQIGKGLSGAGKTSAAAYGSKDKTIATDKVYFSFCDSVGCSNPGYEMMGYAYKIEKFDKGKDTDHPGKLKMRLAAQGKFLTSEGWSWMAGGYEGDLCPL